MFKQSLNCQQTKRSNVRNWIVTAAFVAGVACAPHAFAQGANPSAEQIIKSLTPTGDVSKVTTRGIRMAPQAGATDGIAAVAAPPAAVTPRKVFHAAAPAQADGVAAVNLTVNFGTGSAELTPQAVQALDVLGKALSNEALSQYRFRVEGHTDTVGSAEANRILSEQRAQAVVRYIASKFGIAENRLEPVGLGVEGQLVATGPQVAEPRNRRVQVVNLGG
jgi:outer membrane protein OmpA-like peptidoglycan-associated protein